MILQGDPAQSVPGVFDVPDDSEFGGVLALRFEDPVEPISLRIVDVETGPQDERARIALVDIPGRRRWIDVPGGFTGGDGGPAGTRVLRLNTLDAQRGLSSIATVRSEPRFDPSRVTRMWVLLRGSDAIDDLIVGSVR